MTVKIPPENVLDKILRLFGKKRKIIAPDGVDETYKSNEPYVQIKAKREGFLKALFRR